MPPRTARQRQADMILGRPVAELIAEERANGATWTDIAFTVRDKTDGAVSVSGEAIRQWHTAATLDREQSA